MHGDKGATRVGFNALATRLSHIVHVDLMLDCGVFDDQLRTLLMAEWSDVQTALIAGGWAFAQASELLSVEDFEHILAHIPEAHPIGFLVRAEQPYFVIDGERLEYSWENYRSRWFFASGYDQAVAAAYVWAELYHLEARALLRPAK